MPAEGRENPLLKKGNSDAFFREKYLTKNRFSGRREPAEYVQGLLEKDLKVLEEELNNGIDRKEEMLYIKKMIEGLRAFY